MTSVDAKDYWESLHRASYGLTSVGYIGVGKPFNAWMYRVRRPVFRNTVQPFIPVPDDRRILDIGSGTGFYLDRWRELGFHNITGSDVSELAVKHCENVTRLSRSFSSTLGKRGRGSPNASSTSCRSLTCSSTSPATTGTNRHS
jgi:SAM-dependent methyltransferase